MKLTRKTCWWPVSTTTVIDPACAPGKGTIRASGLKLTGASQLTCTTLPCAGLNWNQLGGGTIYPSATNPLNFQCGTDRLCGVQATDQHMTTPFVTSWNLGIQRAFTSNVSLDLAYVGNHAHGLLAINDINAPPAGAGRFEVFNLLNQTQYGNPQFNGAGGNDPFGTPNQFGESVQTPDVANNNPSLGSGAARSFQLGFRVNW